MGNKFRLGRLSVIEHATGYPTIEPVIMGQPVLLLYYMYVHSRQLYIFFYNVMILCFYAINSAVRPSVAPTHTHIKLKVAKVHKLNTQVKKLNILF